MFAHNKRLQYTVRVNESNPGLANLMLEQFGGPQGELAAACRYFTQALAEDDPGRKDMLMDIATEELSHLEVIGTIVAMLNKGNKAALAEGIDTEAEMYRRISGGGNSSHVTQVLYGGGPALVNSGGQLWNAGYIDSIGDPTADLRSNIAAEARAKIVYERLINLTDDPGVKDALMFLMTREIAHQQSFEKALYSISPNFPPGKLQGKPEFAQVYFNMSQGPGDLRGPWNNEPTFEYIPEPQDQVPVDGGDGDGTVLLSKAEMKAVAAASTRTASDPTSDPLTGAEMGRGESPLNAASMSPSAPSQPSKAGKTGKPAKS